MYTNLFFFGYKLFCQPLKDARTNQLEIVNEFAILLMTYSLLDFSDAEGNPQNKLKVGWFTFSILLSAVMVNLCFIIFNQVRCTYRSIRQAIANRKVKKNIATKNYEINTTV
mmetsp:Transcript_21361/g.15615  ORF Transcript_21361/g.15615 Transcript_21361/m.15615 type:complete len:112 (-) Transcript_21361:124-459(-)